MWKRKSPVHKKKKQVKRRLSPETRALVVQCVIGAGVLLVLSGVVTAVWYGTRAPGMTIATVTAQGGETINSAAVTAAVEGALAGEYLKLVPKRFAWWYPHEDVVAAAASVSRVKDPVVTRVSGTELMVTYDEYIPYALWCSRVDDACVFLDDAGYAFAPAPLLKGSALGRYVTTDIMPAVATMAPFADVLPQVEAWLAEIERVTPLAAEKIEIDAMRDVYVTVAGGGELKFSLNDDLERVLENLTSILASEAFMDIAPGTFRYIDLRFGNKVFVNTELVTTATSTALTSDDAAATGTVLTTMVEDIAASVAEVTESTLELVGTTTASTTE